MALNTGHTLLFLTMSIVAIVSSPRRNANTDTLVAAAAEGVRENGKDVQIFHLNALRDKKGCQGCNACKKNGGKCVTKDDLSTVLDAVRDAEGLILSSPVYFGEACGQYRMLEDRFYGFLKADFSTSFAPGKKVAVITAAGSAGADRLADKMEGTMKNYFKCEPVGKVAAVTNNEADFSAKHADVLEQARALGKKL